MLNQIIWDNALLDGWYSEDSIHFVVENFVKVVNRKLYEEFKAGSEDSCALYDYVISLKLERCADIGHSGQPSIPGRQIVRAFIEERCGNMSKCLWGEKYSRREIFEAIDDFKWVARTRKETKERGAIRWRAKMDRDRVKTVKARELDKRTDWGVVK